jgi:hypothetical protein
VGYLKGVCHASFSTIRKFFRDVLQVPISRGQLVKVINKAAAAMAVAYEQLRTLLPVVKRLRQRFGIGQVCVVSDRGMISDATVATLEDAFPGLKYILGARLRSDHEVRDTVLGWPGRYHEVQGPRKLSQDPSPLKVKDVRFTAADGRDRRFVVCHNVEQAEKDRHDREAIVAALEDQLRHGAKSLVGNQGYRKYLQVEGESIFGIDRAKVQAEARCDGKWVLRSNWDEASAAELALRYKDL